ncbi:uncharacterized protein [Bactrocera oleae]|uniref:uncharacterized protein n=1 Tax=Bactrocera oleae TaxID=104688 RepID=UPI00387EA569
MHSATLSTFVGNRISEIQDLTKGAHWRHVPTQCNPADVASRGCTVKELVNSIWYTGPKFLYENSDKWPKNSCDDIDMEFVDREKRKSAFNTIVSTNYILEIVNQRSNYTSSLRTVKELVNSIWYTGPKFLYENSDKWPKNSCDDIDMEFVDREKRKSAFNTIVSTNYILEIKELTINGPLRYLNPFLEYIEEFQILKVGGRLESADITEERKHPMLLPNKCQFCCALRSSSTSETLPCRTKGTRSTDKTSDLDSQCARFSKTYRQIMHTLYTLQAKADEPSNGTVTCRAFNSISFFCAVRAPHFGGILEAAVKSAKGHLNRTIKNARLTAEELTTVLVDIEAVLNSRPITPM